MKQPLERVSMNQEKDVYSCSGDQQKHILIPHAQL